MVIPAVCDGAIQERATESILPVTVVAVTVGTFTKTSKVIAFEVMTAPAASWAEIVIVYRPCGNETKLKLIEEVEPGFVAHE